MEPFRIAAPLHTQAKPLLQEIEVSSSLQIPSFKVIGLPGPEVAESCERIRAATLSSGLEFPKRRVVLNLSPSSVRKQGTSSDLAMALAVLRNGGSTPAPAPRGFGVAWGELGLDGKIKASGKPLRSVAAAWLSGADWVVFPEAERDEVELAQLELREATPSFHESHAGFLRRLSAKPGPRFRRTPALPAWEEPKFPPGATLRGHL